jgi:uncharacterized NAD(P)/FAD-binding protein YdhS
MGRENTVAIVGGGISGALTAYHLVRLLGGLTVPVRVVVIDPRPELGLGLAYSTTSLQHLLNVPAGKISALPDQPNHFIDWLRANYDPNMAAADFAPRAIFGQYVREILASAPGIEHLQSTVVDCHVTGKKATLQLENGGTLTAQAVVLATGNFNPAALPGVSEELNGKGIYCQSAWEDATFADLPEDAPVTLVGAGLTAVDVLLRLREQGHRGVVTAISKHGVFPKRHVPCEQLSEQLEECVIKGEPPLKARELLRAVHLALQTGKPWRAVVDSIRPRTNELWLALPLAEQKRFRRHLKRRWELARHRMAPSIADRVDAELVNGTLILVQGGLHEVRSAGGGAVVAFRNGGDVAEVIAARVINCTGPDTNYHRVGSPLLNSLFAQGLIVDGPHGAGLWTDQNGALRAEDGTASSLLFTLGPARLGTLFESIAVPELRCQAQELAALLATRMAKIVQAERRPVMAF